MDRVAKFMLILSMFIFTSASHAVEKSAESASYDQKLHELDKKIELYSQDAAAVRRDQLNYQIEKDLLKEAYASNLGTVNTIITLILAAFTIVGALGVRSIGNIRKEFRGELNELISLKAAHEVKMGKVINDVEDAKSKYAELLRVNEEQNGRLRLLETQEKAASAIRDKNYQYALKYIDIGISISEKDVVLNTMKYNCLMKLNRLAEAEVIAEFVLSCEPDNRSHSANLVETVILLGKQEKANRLIQEHAERIFTAEYSYLRWYFEALMNFMAGNSSALKATLKNLPVPNPEEKARRMNWSYDEARYVVTRKKGDPGFMQMATCILFLEGEKTVSELEKSADAA